MLVFSPIYISLSKEKEKTYLEVVPETFSINGVRKKGALEIKKGEKETN